MRARRLPDKAYPALACMLAGVLCAGLAAARWTAAEAAPQAKKPPAEKAKKEETKKPESTTPAAGAESSAGTSSGLFTGFEAASGAGGGEKRATVSAGTKGNAPSFGKDVGNRSPSSTDRSKVASMEGSIPSDADLATFKTQGRLKGAS